LLVPKENDLAGLLFDGTPAESFPRNICGFGDSYGDQLNYDENYDDPGPVIVNRKNFGFQPSEGMLTSFISDVQCKSFETCTVSNGVLCCAYQGKCTNIFTSCTNMNRLNPTPTTTQAGVLTWYKRRLILLGSVLRSLLVATMAKTTPTHHQRLFPNMRIIGTTGLLTPTTAMVHLQV